MDNIYLKKYLKYKSKYLELLQFGSAGLPPKQPNVPTELKIITKKEERWKGLYIALPIDAKTRLGQNLQHRDPNLQFTDYKEDHVGVHLSLLNIYILDNSPLDRLLRNPTHYRTICSNIVEIFRNIIRTSTSTELTILSTPNQYKELGAFYVKEFITLPIYQKFRLDVNNYLMKVNIEGIGATIYNNDDFTQRVDTSNKRETREYKIYSVKGNPTLKHVMANTEYDIKWTPHLSLFRTNGLSSQDIKAKHALFTQKARKHPVSQIRLWPQYPSPLNKDDGGDVTTLYFAYHHRNPTFLPV
jgi:hypothetical protein